MRQLLTLMAMVMVMLCASYAWAANSYTVQSRTMSAGATDCPIRILLANDVELNSYVAPLVIREVTPGAYITALKMSWDDRLPYDPSAPLSDLRITNIYPNPDGTCRPGGFATLGSNDTLKHAVISSPECALFAALKIIGPGLPPGSDAVGSNVLTVDATGTLGTFEIDTTCADPANYILFGDHLGQPIKPSFTKGIITIIANSPPVALCQDVTVSAGPGCQAHASVDNGSFDPDGDPITLTQYPPGPYPLGQTFVELVARDPHCTLDSCSAKVTVVDDVPPVVSCPNDTIISVPPGTPGAIVDFTATATDECSAPSVVCNPPSGSFFPLGITTVTCIGTDTAQNADTCSFLIAVGSVGGYCNDRPEDVNCDGQIDVFDMNRVIDVAFLGQPESGQCCHVKK